MNHWEGAVDSMISRISLPISPNDYSLVRCWATFVFGPANPMTIGLWNFFHFSRRDSSPRPWYLKKRGVWGGGGMRRISNLQNQPRCIPPPGFCDGWLCFVGSLMGIGGSLFFLLLEGYGFFKKGWRRVGKWNIVEHGPRVRYSTIYKTSRVSFVSQDRGGGSLCLKCKRTEFFLNENLWHALIVTGMEKQFLANLTFFWLVHIQIKKKLHYLYNQSNIWLWISYMYIDIRLYKCFTIVYVTVSQLRIHWTFMCSKYIMLIPAARRVDHVEPETVPLQQLLHLTKHSGFPPIFFQTNKPPKVWKWSQTWSFGCFGGR